MLALLAFHSKFSLDVDNMSDDEIVLAWNRLQYGLTKNGQYNS